VQWEIGLLLHLLGAGAPVVRPVRGRNGYLEHVLVDGQPRIAVLFTWAPGSKPPPTEETYGLLGDAAARIHRPAYTFAPSPAREDYNAAILIDEQLQRMRPLLVRAGRWRQAVSLGGRMKDRLDEPGLDRGICHMDLTLDNVHLGRDLTVFDFDSAGVCWRALEPWGVLRSSATRFEAWMAGYRTTRSFSVQDEAAVAAFGIVGDFRVVAWKLGVAESSRGSPLLGVQDLPDVVDGWLDWEAAHLGA
jgi:Ser/Thr protein kinase RdoA (MazF antagonist)